MADWRFWILFLGGPVPFLSSGRAPVIPSTSVLTCGGGCWGLSPPNHTHHFLGALRQGS